MELKRHTCGLAIGIYRAIKAYEVAGKDRERRESSVVLCAITKLFIEVSSFF